MITRRTFVKASALGTATAFLYPSLVFNNGFAWAATDSTMGMTDVDANSTLVTGGYLEFVVNHDIMKGTDNLFRPNDELTRAEAATILCRGGTGASSDDPDASTNTTGLVDVEANTWYTASVNWAVSVGIITGYRNSDGTYTHFGSYDSATRQDLAVMLQRLVSYVYGKTISSTTSTSSSISDLSSTADYATDAVTWAVEIGALSLTSKKVRPLDYTTRAEAAQAITEVLLWADPQRKYTNLILTTDESEADYVGYFYETGKTAYYRNPSVFDLAATTSLDRTEDFLFYSAWFPKDSTLENEPTLSHIIETDDRTEVLNTSIFPYKAIGCLYTNVLSGRGTAFMVSSTSALTAAHNVFDGCKFYSELEFYPGQNNDGISPSDKNSPFCLFVPKKYYDGNYGEHDEKADHDFALVVFSSFLGTKTGYFGYGYQSNDFNQGQSFEVSGYPEYVDNAKTYNQWHSQGYVTASHAQRVEFDIDATDGDSGAPLFYPKDSLLPFITIGVVNRNGYEDSYNVAKRITVETFTTLRATRVNGENS